MTLLLRTEAGRYQSPERRRCSSPSSFRTRSRQRAGGKIPAGTACWTSALLIQPEGRGEPLRKTPIQKGGEANETALLVEPKGHHTVTSYSLGVARGQLAQIWQQKRQRRGDLCPLNSCPNAKLRTGNDLPEGSTPEVASSKAFVCFYNFKIYLSSESKKKILILSIG